MRQAPCFQLLRDIAGGVRILGEHKHFIVLVGFCDKILQGVELLVAGGLPLAAMRNHLHDGFVVGIQRGRERFLEKGRADPFHRGRRVRHKRFVRLLARLRVFGRFGRDFQDRFAGCVHILGGAVADIGIRRADGQGESILDGVKVHRVPHGVAVEGHQKRDTARIHPLEESAEAKTHHALAGARKIVENPFLGGGSGLDGGFVDILLETVARKRQILHPVYHLPAIETLEHVAGGGREHNRPRDAVREVVAGAVLHLQVLASVALVGQGIVLLDERAGAANEIQLHQVAPVIGENALLERLDRSERNVAVLDGELLFPSRGLDLLFGTDAEVEIGIDEKLQLVGEVEVILVVRSCRQQKDLVALIGQEVLDHRIPLAFRIAQVMAFVDDDQLEEPFPAGVKLLGNRARLHL